MKLTTILFDLDGTLLPMDNDEFTKGYFRLLAAKLAPHGYDPKQLVDGIWAGTAAMVRNDGSRTNEKAFWDKFSSIFGEAVLEDLPLFEEFYETDFQAARDFCGFNPDAAATVHAVKKLGLRAVLATNPIFPAIATRSRIRWAGLKPEDFELYTTYENIGLCKPNPAYYQEILKRLGVRPEECLMVGNDATEDMAAAETGMRVFLLTDCLLNKENKDISAWPHGGFPQLMDYMESLCREDEVTMQGESPWRK